MLNMKVNRISYAFYHFIEKSTKKFSTILSNNWIYLKNKTNNIVLYHLYNQKISNQTKLIKKESKIDERFNLTYKSLSPIWLFVQSLTIMLFIYIVHMLYLRNHRLLPYISLRYHITIVTFFFRIWEIFRRNFPQMHNLISI